MSKTITSGNFSSHLSMMAALTTDIDLPRSLKYSLDGEEVHMISLMADNEAVDDKKAHT